MTYIRYGYDGYFEIFVQYKISRLRGLIGGGEIQDIYSLVISFPGC